MALRKRYGVVGEHGGSAAVLSYHTITVRRRRANRTGAVLVGVAALLPRPPTPQQCAAGARTGALKHYNSAYSWRFAICKMTRARTIMVRRVRIIIER